jgi:hydroxylysine kinase
MREDRVAAPFSKEQAVALAREIYGLQGVARALPGEYDASFHLKTDECPGFVLKVMHPARERALIDLQCQALLHLARRAPELALPRVCQTRDGATVASVSGPDGTERLVWMLTYVPGRVLAEVRPHSGELLLSLGRLLGQMDAALVGFSHPAAHRELKWDLARAGWIRDCLHHISDPARRALVARFLALFES